MAFGNLDLGAGFHRLFDRCVERRIDYRRKHRSGHDDPESGLGGCPCAKRLGSSKHSGGDGSCGLTGPERLRGLGGVW